MPATQRAAKPAKTKIVGMRIPPDKLAKIDDLAKGHKLSRTEYMVRVALGEPLNTPTLEQRVAELERRLEQIERRAAEGKPGGPGSPKQL